MALDSYSTTGPDGKGFDANITSPKDFKLALEEIFASLTKLRELHWRSEVLSFYSSVIDQLEASNTLDVLYVAFSACEEDYLIPPDSMPSEGLPEPTPVWKLSKNLSRLGIACLRESMRDVFDIDPELIDSKGADDPLVERQCRAFTRFVKPAEKITSIDLSGLWWVGEEGQRPDVLASVLPTLACVPVTVKGYGLLNWSESPVPPSFTCELLGIFS